MTCGHLGWGRKNWGGKDGNNQAALTAVAVHLSPKEVMNLKEIFKNLYHNKDSSLNQDGLRQGLSDMKNSDDFLELLSAVDMDQNGTINYTGTFKNLVNQYI